LELGGLISSEMVFSFASAREYKPYEIWMTTRANQTVLMHCTNEIIIFY
jgi:hypothetical protein